MLKLHHWIRDYVHLGRGYAREILYRRPPEHYLGYIETGRPPIILIPGVFTTWRFLKQIGDALSLRGHPIYVIEDLKYHHHPIPISARMVRVLIEEKDLHDVVIIGHSKGGLVGKFILAFVKELQRHAEVNNKIVSIYGVFDNHVWPVESCRLEGARNIQLREHGHHAILASKKLRETILEMVQ